MLIDEQRSKSCPIRRHIRQSVQRLGLWENTVLSLTSTEVGAKNIFANIVLCGTATDELTP